MKRWQYGARALRRKRPLARVGDAVQSMPEWMRLLVDERYGAEHRRGARRALPYLGLAQGPGRRVMPRWPAALLITLAIEVPVVVALFPGQRVRMGAVAAVVNTASNLFLNLVLARMRSLAGHHVLPGELLAVVGEAAAYAAFSRPHDLPRALLASSLGNALSFAAGLTALPSLLG